MNDREMWWERVRDIRATSTTWWWRWYIYICVCVCVCVCINNAIYCNDNMAHYFFINKEWQWQINFAWWLTVFLLHNHQTLYIYIYIYIFMEYQPLPILQLNKMVYKFQCQCYADYICRTIQKLEVWVKQNVPQELLRWSQNIRVFSDTRVSHWRTSGWSLYMLD